jgi:hypothetical protein
MLDKAALGSYEGKVFFPVLSMIPKSGYRFLEKIMLHLKGERIALA